ncbi:MAG: globin [Ilumatobacteraceae bacterium]
MSEHESPQSSPPTDGAPEAAVGEETISLYEAIGGMPFFERLVAKFYEGVIADEVLAPLYDHDDLDGAERRLSTFLAQYFGGPTTYLEERGHPRLRMRHMPFRVGPVERDRWLVNMRAALDACDPHPVLRQMLLEYFEPAAEHLRNDTGLPISLRQQVQTPGQEAARVDPNT